MHAVFSLGALLTMVSSAALSSLRIEKKRV